MRIVTFQVGGAQRLGALVEGRILDLQATHVYITEKGTAGSLSKGARLLAEAEMPTDAVGFIELGSKSATLAQALLDHVANFPEAATTSQGESIWFSLDDVRLLAPIPRPGKIICIGLNYIDHAHETNMPVPKNPVLFSKFNTAIVGPEEPIVHPGVNVTKRLDYEAELVVVIGRKGKNIQKEQAMDYVFGYTAMNDVSARDLQMEDGQWLKGKTLDSFAPIGPAVVTASDISDPHSLRISLSLNGKVLQDSNTRNLIFKIPDLIAYLSKLMTLLPGDIIATGTPPGVGMARNPEVYMKAGDTVSVEIEGVGVLTNPVMASVLP